MNVPALVRALGFSSSTFKPGFETPYFGLFGSLEIGDASLGLNHDGIGRLFLVQGWLSKKTSVGHGLALVRFSRIRY
jgi:hypothetical protein